MDLNFQVDLRSIIQLLSNNLYSGPQVFVRELIQNSVDAIQARKAFDPDIQGKIEMELMRTSDNGRLLIIEDNGVGLTSEEVHRFLATIGSSSKRDGNAEARTDFIGQFGIGLLSCFIVTDEIILLSHSRKGGKPVEWKGRADGTYTLRELDSNMSVGTKIYLRPSKDKENFFAFERLLAMAKNYASMLPFPITLQEAERKDVVNSVPPWRTTHANEEATMQAYFGYGMEVLSSDFFDFVPLKDAHFEGVAYVLAFSPNPAARRTNRLYLKNILISEDADNVLPDWAFFVKCIVNADNLTPTASRESVCDNEALKKLRDSVGAQLKHYIFRLSKYDPARLQQFLSLHSRAIKHLATFEDEFLLLFIDHMPFESNFGVTTLAECRRKTDEIFYVRQVDDFKQVAEISAAQGIRVINAGYSYETEILERYSTLKPELAPKPLSVVSFAQKLKEISLTERNDFHELLMKADRILSRYHVRTNIRHFQPESLPVIFIASQEMLFRRSVEDVKRTSTPAWSGILENIMGDEHREKPELCFNASNHLIESLARHAKVHPIEHLKEVVEVLYVQSLLFGRRSLTPQEVAALNDGVLKLTETHLKHL